MSHDALWSEVQFRFPAKPHKSNHANLLGVCLFVLKEVIELQNDQRTELDLGLIVALTSFLLHTGITACLQPVCNLHLIDTCCFCVQPSTPHV